MTVDSYSVNNRLKAEIIVNCQLPITNCQLSKYLLSLWPKNSKYE